MAYIDTSKAARMCPKCAADSRVYDSREQPDGSLLRRRECKECGLRFSTIEVLKEIISDHNI